MLHHQHRIALVPQLSEQLIHAVDITGVHPGAGLVKNIRHPAETAAHIPHQLQALRLPAGKRRRLPVQMQIRQADLDHSVQALDQRLDQRAHRLIRDLCQDFPELGQLQLTQIGDRIAVDLRAERRLIQPLTVTGGALGLDHELLGFLLGMLALAAEVAVEERLGVLLHEPRHLGIFHLPLTVPRAIQEQSVFLAGVVLDRLIQIEEA